MANYTAEFLERVSELEKLRWQEIESAAEKVDITEKPEDESWKAQAEKIAIAEFEREGKPYLSTTESNGEENTLDPPEPAPTPSLSNDSEDLEPVETASDRFYASLGLKLEGPNKIPVPIKQ